MSAEQSSTAIGLAVTESITLGGGCFWCLEAVYAQVDGVLEVESGYSNGPLRQPSYEQVCSGRTGHAEVVRLVFDTQRISLREVLEIFFCIHDPTTLNRQGHDSGSQYRSGIYWHTPSQETVARALVAELAGSFDAPIVTEITPLDNYWPAEAYHQRYYAQHPEQGYCAYVIAPKLSQFRQRFAARVVA